MEEEDKSDVEDVDEFDLDDDFDPLVLDADEASSGSDEGGEDSDANETPAADEKPSSRLPNPQLAQALDTRRIIIISDDERQTSNIMTKAEVARATAIRAEYISKFPNAFVEIGDLTQADEIAQKELYEHRSPLILRRDVGRTAAGERQMEKWKVREMSYPPLN